MSDNRSAAAITAAANDMIAKLEELDHQLRTEMRGISAAAAREGRALSDAEKNRIDALQADDDKIGDAIQAISIQALIDLNNSSEVAALKAKFNSVNSNLTGTITRLKNIARTAATAAQVADGLAQLVETAAALTV
jgi:hypothetical protein